MRIATTPSVSRSTIAAALAATAIFAAGCGDDEAKSDNTGGGDGGSTQTASSKDGTWVDYMGVRDGFKCSATAEAQGVKAKSTVESKDFKESGDTATFTLATSVAVEAAGAKPVSFDLPYTQLADGSLRTEPNIPAPGFDITIDGELEIPSVEQLRAGEKKTSSYTMTMTPTDPAVRDQLLSQLKDGAKGLEMKATSTVELAPEKKSVKAGDETFTDIVGMKTTFDELEVTNGDSEAIAAMSEGMKAGLGEGSITYFARDHGQVEVEVIGSAAKQIFSECEA